MARKRKPTEFTINHIYIPVSEQEENEAYLAFAKTLISYEEQQEKVQDERDEQVAAKPRGEVKNYDPMRDSSADNARAV